MTQSDDTRFGCELIASMDEALAIMKGEQDAARVHLPPGEIDVRALRQGLGLTRPRSPDGSGWRSRPCKINSKVCADPIQPRACC